MPHFGNQGSLRNHLIRSASGTFIIKVFSTALGMASAIVLARLLGVKGFGVYVFCLSVVQMLTVPAVLGGKQLLVREISAYLSKAEFSLMRGLLLRLRQASLCVALLLALASAGVGILLHREGDSRYLLPFLLSLPLLPLLSSIQLQESALKGLRRIITGQIHLILRPLLVIVLMAMLFLYFGGILAPEYAIGAQVISASLLTFVLGVLLHRVMPEQSRYITPAFENRRWVKSALPFMLFEGMVMLNSQSSIILLGTLQDSEAVGLFRVAQRGMEVVRFSLIAVDMSLGPTASSLFALGEKKRLQQLVHKSILAIIGFSLPVTLGIIIAGKWIISLLFGPDYVSAYPALVILCVGNLLSLTMGSVGMLLNMTGFEKYAVWGLSIAAVTSVALNLILIPYFGITGAAIASPAGLIVCNILLVRWLYKNTGILSMPRLKF